MVEEAHSARRWLAGLGVVAALIAAGCGGGSSSEKSADSGSSGSQSDSAGLSAATSQVATYSKAPTDLGVSSPLPGSVAGKRVYYLQCSAPSCAFAGDGIAAAAKVLGVRLTRVDEGASPEQVTAAWNKVVSDRPDGVIQAGFSATSFARQLRQVKANRIPYVAMGAPDCDGVRDPCSGPNPGVTINLLGKRDFERAARLAADYVVSESKGSADAVFFYIPDFPINVVTRDAFVAEYKKTCPQCKLETVSAQATDIGKALPTAVASHLQRHPDTDHVVMAFGDMAIGVPAAVRLVSPKVKIVSPFGGPTNYANIKSGNVEAADIGLAYGYLGWRAIDAVARAMLGASLKPEATQLPEQVLDQRAVATFDIKGYWPGVEGYEEKFTALWKR